MTDQQHPITPSPELIKEWRQDTLSCYRIGGVNDIVVQAARWGADQELQACVDWVSHWCPRWPDGTHPEDELRAARRPKPSSLKEQALKSLEGLVLPDDAFTTISRALNLLDD